MDYGLALAEAPRRPAVFLDRDGVINARPQAHHYVTDYRDFHWTPAVAYQLGRLPTYLPLIVVTNQPCVGKGLISQKDLNSLHHWMVAWLDVLGVRIAGVYACPHTEEDGCECRKPKPGLLLQAAQDHAIDLARSYMIGDSACDAEAAWAAGVPSVYLILPEDGSDPCPAQPQGEYWVVEELASVVDAILAREAR